MKPSSIVTQQAIEPHWIVKDMLPRGTTVLLAGEAGAGKSFLSYVLAYSVASGLPFLGHQTVPTRVLYFDEENGEPDFLQYNQWVWSGLGQPDLPALDERLEIEHNALVAGWREKVLVMMGDLKAELVVFDTATPAFSVKEENDNSEATEICRILRGYRQKTGQETTFLILKHERMRDDPGHRRTIRGAKAWMGAADQVLFHVASKGRRRKDGLRKTQLLPEKMRAFGLRNPIVIDPQWADTSQKGLILNGYSADIPLEALEEK